MSTEERQADPQPRLTIIGEDVTPDRAALLSRLARALGHSDIAYTAGTIEDLPYEPERPSSPFGLDAIIQAHRLYFEQGPRLRDEQPDSPRRLGHRLIGSLIRDAADDYVRRDLPRAFGLIEVLASHSEVADRSLAADMLNTGYREAVRAGQISDARSLHGVWRRLTNNDDLRDIVKSCGLAGGGGVAVSDRRAR